MTAWRTGHPDALVRLGRGTLAVPAISFGAAPIGNLGTAVSDEDAEAAVHAAWASGIRYFDVAPHYGLGLAEIRLGRALRNYPRDEYLLSTKVGRVLVDVGQGTRDDAQGFAVRSPLRRVFDFSADGVRRSLDASLERLGLDRVDIAYVHDPQDHFAQALAGAFPALDRLRADGVIRSYGAGMNTSPMLAAIIRETDADVVLAARSWTLANRSALEDLLPMALDRDVTVVAAGAFTGIDLADETSRIAELSRSYGVPLVAVAAQFPLLHPAVSTVLLGMRSAAEVTTDHAALATDIPSGFWAALLREFRLPGSVTLT